MEKVKSIKQLGHYYYSGDRELLFCINVDTLDLEDLVKLSSYAKSDFKFIGKGNLVVNDKVVDKCREIIYGMDIDSLSLKDIISISNYATKDTIKNDEIISKCKELIYGVDIKSLDFEDLIRLGGYATKDTDKNDEIINKCREIISEKYTTLDVPVEDGRPDYKSLTNTLKVIRDLFCTKEIMSFTKDVRDPEFYSAGVIDTVEVEYIVYTPVIPVVIQINGDADLYMKMVHGYCINGRETQPLIEKIKGLTIRIMNPFGKMVRFNYKGIRKMWEDNRIACASECTQYSIENPIVDDSMLNKLGMVLSVYSPHRIVKDDLTGWCYGIAEILRIAGIDNYNVVTKRILDGDCRAVDAFINYCLEKELNIYNLTDLNKIDELYETVKPELYGNANYLEAQIYGYGVEE